MQIKAEKKYREPDYPTIDGAGNNSSLLKSLPRRWILSTSLSSAMSASFLAEILLCQVSTADEKTQKFNIEELATANKRKYISAKDLQIKRTTTLVAPLLEEALAFDGRGSFGCMCINPPTFLAEDEAIELIKNELNKAGLHCEEAVELENIEYPRAKKPDPDIISFPKSKTMELANGTFEFDLADKEKGVYIEFLSTEDHQKWTGDRPYSGGSVWSYDFAKLSKDVSASFSKHKSKKPPVIGIIFEPMAGVDTPRPNVAGLAPEQARLAWSEYQRAQKKTRENLDDIERDKLRKQVSHFIETLRKEGIIEKGS